MSLRRSIINKANEDPVLAKIVKSLSWQWKAAKKLEVPKIVTPGTAMPIKVSSDGKVTYEDTKHIYFDENKSPLISVTTLLGAFKPPFDAKRMSTYCAEKEDYETNCLVKPDNWESLSTPVRAEMIRMAWEQNRNEAADYGTFTHACLEHKGRNIDLTPVAVLDQMKEKFGDSITHIEPMLGPIPNFIYEFEWFWHKPKFRHIGEVRFEPILYDFDISVAGQSDVVIIDHKNKRIHIADHKTNKHKPGSELDAPRNNMLGPLSHLFTNDITSYRLQLCLYQAFLVKMMPGYGYGTNWILWLNRETGKIEPIEVDPREEALNIRAIYRYMLENKNKIYNE